MAPTVPFSAMVQWLGRAQCAAANSWPKPRWCICPFTFSSTSWPAQSYTALVEGSSGKVLANLFPAKAETPYLAVTVFATLGFLVLSCLPLAGFAIYQGTGLLVGVLAYLAGGAVFAAVVFAVAAYVSAKV